MNGLRTAGCSDINHYHGLVADLIHGGFLAGAINKSISCIDILVIVWKLSIARGNMKKNALHHFFEIFRWKGVIVDVLAGGDVGPSTALRLFSHHQQSESD